jgi:hypothetical protein
MWRALAVVCGLAAPFFFLVLLFAALVFHAAGIALALALFTFVPAAATLLFAVRKAGARGREIGPNVDAAWLAAATEISDRAGGAISARQLGAALRATDAQAEELLALVSVNDMVSNVPRTRIAAPLEIGGSDHVEQAAHAEAEAEAAQLEAAAAQAKRTP